MILKLDKHRTSDLVLIEHPHHRPCGLFNSQITASFDLPLPDASPSSPECGKLARKGNKLNVLYPKEQSRLYQTPFEYPLSSQFANDTPASCRIRPFPAHTREDLRVTGNQRDIY